MPTLGNQQISNEFISSAQAELLNNELDEQTQREIKLDNEIAKLGIKRIEEREAIAKGEREPLKPIINSNGEPVNFRRVLNHNGASLSAASRTIANILKHSKYDNSKLRAAELVLDLHGIRDKDGEVKRQPIFNFVIKDSSVNLNQIFAPSRQATPVEIVEEPETNLDELES